MTMFRFRVNLALPSGNAGMTCRAVWTRRLIAAGAHNSPTIKRFLDTTRLRCICDSGILSGHTNGRV